MADGLMADKERLLFVCVGNTCRSQMAEGFARTYAGPAVGVKSAGTSALGYVHRSTVDAMAEVGIDITGQTSDQLIPEMLSWATFVVTLGCAPAEILCPPTFTGVKLDWPIRDPFGMPDDFMRTVRDEIETRVKALIDGLR